MVGCQPDAPLAHMTRGVKYSDGVSPTVPVNESYALPHAILMAGRDRAKFDDDLTERRYSFCHRREGHRNRQGEDLRPS